MWNKLVLVPIRARNTYLLHHLLLRFRPVEEVWVVFLRLQEDIEESLGERKMEDVVKCTAGPSALGKPSNKARDRQFRSDQRPGGFGHGSHEQSLTGVGAGLPFCDKCGR
ncbi:hypothetical protein V6N13_004060 [Hibiscus sabdariffa]|uniref:Uncharacterized protein n=2 Tax=Hibiscus sabdariffa TaxID=183260 RepID=A0ABR1ZPV4_9ROSI